jgi:ubiquinone/menaquinone biosynthesis C-methylase UbiE
MSIWRKLKAGFAGKTNSKVDDYKLKVSHENGADIQEGIQLINREEVYRAEYAATMKESFMPTWCVDDLKINGDCIEIQGWAFAPDNDKNRIRFQLNNKNFDEVIYPLPRKDIENLFWYIPNSIATGFFCKSTVTDRECNTLSPYSFKLIDRISGNEINKLQNYYYCHDSRDGLPIPPALNRRRVHGADSESAFLLEGYTTFVKIRELIKDKFKRDYKDFESILDWGCGCGRMARYFNWIPGVNITGIDIDQGNIDWCRQNLKFGKFLTTDIHPKTQLPDDHFDLLIGISIFSHLKEKEMHEWLDELKRITKPEGILLMSIHSTTTVLRANLPTSTWKELKKTGFVDAGANFDLDTEKESSDYYRNTFFEIDYINRVWSKYFEIFEIIPGFVGNHQDLVIMKKTSPY